MARLRSPWGSVRRLPSGRHQARYRLDGLEYLAEETFRTQREADEYLAAVRADIQREAWVDPDAGRVTLDEYASLCHRETGLRLGRSDRASILYQHATMERDVAIANALSDVISDAVLTEDR